MLEDGLNDTEREFEVGELLCSCDFGSCHYWGEIGIVTDGREGVAVPEGPAQPHRDRDVPF